MRKTAYIFILALAFAAWGSPAGALQVLVDAYWSDINTASPDGNGGSNLQNGSIIQVVLFQSQGGQPPSKTDATDNFQVYGTTDSDPVVYLPNTTLEGNYIAYTGALTVNGTTAEFYQWVDIPNALLAVYDKIYIRVFSETEFTLGEATENWWGISDVNTIPITGAGTGWTWFDDTEVKNQDYFEVIPEPTAAALLCLGFGSLAGTAFRRKKRQGIGKRADIPGVREP